MQKLQGIITKWRDDKGFGFINANTGDDYFFHISEYEAISAHTAKQGHDTMQRPSIGQKVTFIASKDKQGRMRAKKVSAVARKQTQSNPDTLTRQNQRHTRANERQNRQSMFKQQRAQAQLLTVVLAILLYGALIVASWLGYLNIAVAGWYGLLSLVTFLVYAKDKSAAQNGRWRTPEYKLHLLSLLGGWIGAMLAQCLLRHKSKKASFRAVYYMTIIVNIMVFIYLTFFTNSHLEKIANALPF